MGGSIYWYSIGEPIQLNGRPLQISLKVSDLQTGINMYFFLCGECAAIFLTAHLATLYLAQSAEQMLSENTDFSLSPSMFLVGFSVYCKHIKTLAWHFPHQLKYIYRCTYNCSNFLIYYIFIIFTTPLLTSLKCFK